MYKLCSCVAIWLCLIDIVVKNNFATLSFFLLVDWSCILYCLCYVEHFKSSKWVKGALYIWNRNHLWDNIWMFSFASSAFCCERFALILIRCYVLNLKLALPFYNSNMPLNSQREVVVQNIFSFTQQSSYTHVVRFNQFDNELYIYTSNISRDGHKFAKVVT